MNCNSEEQFDVYSHFSSQLKRAQIVSRTEDVFCRFCELTFPRLEQLSLTSQFYWYEYDPEIAVGFIQRHSTLRSLCIDIVSKPKALVNVITNHILQLTALSIALNPYCRMNWEKGSFESLAKLTKLKHLKCRGDIGTNIFYKCKAITSLKSVYVKLLCTHDQLDLLRDVHKVAPQLKSLGIGGTETNESAVKFICKHFSNLSCLKIRWSKVETGEGLARIANLPRLRELGLWTYDECRDYRHIPRNHVRFLTLCCNWKDSDGDLLQLPKIFPGLEKLDLYPLVTVRSSTVERIHKMIPECRINVHRGSACLQPFNDAINVE
ncbi:uncharacterized protein LOC128268186 [Anopheles cruzii]|uniref:uncharacterized protein LOC128268186 n=1 Tax=Anopheles cruzii TaxID=68878 RepID=UPI0022EC7975|nr:uncharacterized protein LOC128268186 [Anopheles cruzii]